MYKNAVQNRAEQGEFVVQLKKDNPTRSDQNYVLFRLKIYTYFGELLKKKTTSRMDDTSSDSTEDEATDSRKQKLERSGVIVDFFSNSNTFKTSFSSLNEIKQDNFREMDTEMIIEDSKKKHKKDRKEKEKSKHKKKRKREDMENNSISE